MVKKNKKLLVCLVLLVAALTLLFTFLQRTPEAFSDKLVMQNASDPRWDIAVSHEKFLQVEAYLKAPYHYLGKGKQCIAYESGDEAYVIKLLLQKKLHFTDFMSKLPDFFPFSLYKDQKVKGKATRKKSLLESFKIAYEIIPEYTGVVFLHLNPTKKLYNTICLIDQKQNPQLVDVNPLQFVVQKKAKLLKPAICEYVWSGDVDAAKRCIDYAFDLLFQCAKKGVTDLDTALIRNNNIGLLDDRAIYIDIGKLRYMPDIQQKHMFVKDLHRLKPLHTWLKKYYPELAEYYQFRQKEVIEAF